MTEKEGNLITQKTFRTLLQAMSHPGKVYKLETMNKELSELPFSKEWMGGFYAALISVLITLLDHEVTFNVVGHQRKEWEYMIIRATGSRTANIDDADFVIIPSGDSEGAILHAKRGSPEYPDTGATVIYFLNSICSILPHSPRYKRTDLRVTLKGPGINGEMAPLISGIKKDEFYYLKQINSEYPLGVDCIFIDAENRIMCIPRSTKIEVI